MPSIWSATAQDTKGAEGAEGALHHFVLRHGSVELMSKLLARTARWRVRLQRKTSSHSAQNNGDLFAQTWTLASLFVCCTWAKLLTFLSAMILKGVLWKRKSCIVVV